MQNETTSKGRGPALEYLITLAEDRQRLCAMRGELGRIGAEYGALANTMEAEIDALAATVEEREDALGLAAEEDDEDREEDQVHHKVPARRPGSRVAALAIGALGGLAVGALMACLADTKTKP